MAQITITTKTDMAAVKAYADARVKLFEEMRGYYRQAVRVETVMAQIETGIAVNGPWAIVRPFFLSAAGFGPILQDVITLRQHIAASMDLLRQINDTLGGDVGTGTNIPEEPV